MKNRKRNRMKGYDYSRNNMYFVTVCVQDRECCFGNIISEGATRELSVHNHMELNAFGEIAQKRLLWLEERYDYVVLHSHIVMPNHIHAIIEIDSNLIEDKKTKIKSLSELMGAYKTTSSKLIHKTGYLAFKWQRSFHDHIIRNTIAFENISRYIDTNANQWKKDTFFK